MRPICLALHSTLALAIAAAALTLPREARAGEALPAVEPEAHVIPLPPPRWGLHSGDTIDQGSTLIYGEVGFPDVSIGFQRGVSSNIDLGFRASFFYGIDYVVPRSRPSNVTQLTPGLGLSIPVRFTLVRSDRVSVLVHADPGLKFDGFNPKVFAGPELPLGIDLGVHLTQRSTLTLGADIPLSLRVTPDVTGFIPLLVGLTFESCFTDRFGMSFNLRSGVVHGINKTGSDTDLGLLGQVGFLGRI